MLPLFDMLTKAQQGNGMEALARQFNLTQQHAVVGLAGRGAGGLEIAAAQGVEGGGVAEAVRGTQGGQDTAFVVPGMRRQGDAEAEGERHSARRRGKHAAENKRH